MWTFNFEIPQGQQGPQGPPGAPTVSRLGGVQLNQSVSTAQANGIIPFGWLMTNNNANLSADLVAGVTVTAAGTYLINWTVASDNNAAVALYVNGAQLAASPMGTYLLTANATDVIALYNTSGNILTVDSAYFNVAGVIS